MQTIVQRLALLTVFIVSWTGCSYAQQRGLTHEKTAKSGANFKIDMGCSPSISTPDNETGGQIVVTLQLQVNGEWSDESMVNKTTTTPTWTSLTGESPSDKWQYEIEFNQTLTNARLCFLLKVSGENVGAPLYVEFSVDPKVTELQDSSGNSMSSISLTTGVSTTFYLKVKNVSTDTLDSSFEGTYHLQLFGPGSTGFTINDKYSADVEIVNGVGSFQLKALAGSSSATLVGFDADVADSSERAGSIQVEIYRNGASGFGS